MVDVDVPPEEKSAGRARRGALPWLATLAVGALLLLFLYGLTTQRLETGVTPSQDTVAPDFQLSTFDGTSVHLAAFLGRPVVVNFWASWCVPCKDEQPALNAVWQNYRDRVVFLGVDIQDTQRDALNFLRQYTMAYPAVSDPQGTVYINYGVVGMPETYLITRQGMIGRKIVGPVDPRDLAASLDAMLR